MTISSQIRKAGPFVGNDSSTVFPFAFKVFAASDLYVVKTDTELVADTVLVLTTDYTVSLNANQDSNPGGTVTLPGVLATGFKLTITSSLQYLQPTDLTNNGGFYPKVITNALDRLTIFVQQIVEKLGRSLTLPISVSGVSTELPVPLANHVIAWNDTATGLQSLDAADLATIVAFGTTNADKFDGDGTTTQFVLSANPGALNNLDVSIGGVTQRPGIDYTWTSGTTITFTSAPPAGTNNVLVRYMQGLPQGQTAADLVSYSPDGAGAVTTNAQTKLRRVQIDVSDFGGDLQKAIDAASLLGGGVVVVDSDVSASAITMKSLVEVIGNAGTYVGTSSPSAVGKRVITITGSGTGVAFGNGTTGVYGAALRNVEVYTTTGVDGVVFNGGPGSATASCEVENIRANGFSAGGIVSKGHAFTNRIVRSGGANCDIGIDLQEEANDTVILDPQCSANRVNIRVGDGSGVSQDGIVIVAGNNDSATDEGILIGAPTNSITIIAPYIEGSGKEPVKSTATTATITIQGGKLIGPSASYDGINLAAGCIFDISGVAFGGSTRYDVNLSAAASYYGRLGPCRHGSTAASGRFGNSATGDSLLDITDAGTPAHLFRYGIQPGNVAVSLGTVLDWYEEGTFTPTVAGNSTPGSHTYSVQNGYFTRVGNRVFFNLDVAISSKDAAMAGYVLINGLPYTSNSASNNGSGAAVGNADLWNLSAGYTFLLPMVQASSAAVILREGGDNVNAQLVQAAAVSTGTRITVSGHYRV